MTASCSREATEKMDECAVLLEASIKDLEIDTHLADTMWIVLFGWSLDDARSSEMLHLSCKTI